MRSTLLNLEESRIREVANAGMGRDDVLAFWFGKSDEVTPGFIRQAAIDSPQRGETSNGCAPVLDIVAPDGWLST